MPSGAKKRKAARKKKEKETHLKESIEDPQGTDELKSQDEKDSDTGGSNSPVHPENHDHENQFSEGIERVKERDPSIITGGVVEGGYEEEMVSKVKERYVSEDSNFEDVKESNNGNVENTNLNQVDESGMSDKQLQEEASDSLSEALQYDSLVRIDSSTHPDTIESAPSSSFVISSVEPIAPSSEFSSEVTDKHMQEEASDSVSEVLQYDDDLVKIDYSTHILVQDAIESISASSTVTSSIESVIPSSELSSEVTHNIPVEKPVTKPEKNEGNTYGNAKAVTSEMQQKPKEYDTVELPSSDIPIAETRNGDEHGKESGITECSENQPLLSSAPQVVRKTSWLSCCGLFELLSGSDK